MSASAPAPAASHPRGMRPPAVTDVCIVGAGPAGMMANLCLTTYGLQTVHIDERSEMTTAGRADGIQPRTLEVLRNIGGVDEFDEPGDIDTGRAPFNGGNMAKTMIKQGVRVYEVAFWDPTETEKLARTSRAASCPEAIVDVDDPFTLLLHQGRIEKTFSDETELRRKRLPANSSPAPVGGVFRSYKFVSCRTLDASHDELAKTHPVEMVTSNDDGSTHITVRSRYLLGCDGARSLVRRFIAGGEVGDGEWQGKIRMEGEATDIVWGVIDAQITTDFPDLHLKCLIHSRDQGSIMVIPRENSLVRFYVQLETHDAEGKKIAIERSKATQDICIARAKAIFDPFKLEFGYVDWFSVYQIGQRIASKYTLDQKIFLGGDATHTHSPKAGQGMNISMLDMYSLAWKINMVEKGVAKPEVLLPTYESERQSVARELLKFDAAYSRLFSGRAPPGQTEIDAHDAGTGAPVVAKKAGPAVDAKKFIEAFKANARFTSGCGAVYFANVLNALPDSDIVKGPHGAAFNPSGCKLVCGERLLPGKVVRAFDSNPIRAHQAVKMDGAYRLYVMAGDLGKTKAQLQAFSDHLEAPSSFHNRHRPAVGVRASMLDGVRDGVISARQKAEQASSHQPNPFFTVLTIIASRHHDWEIADLPPACRFYHQQVYSDSVFDRRVAEVGTNAPLHTKYGIDTASGAIVVVRPDGYVGAVVKLDHSGFDALDGYFAGFMRDTATAAKTNGVNGLH